jgi:hypothetical protein
MWGGVPPSEQIIKMGHLSDILPDLYARGMVLGIKGAQQFIHLCSYDTGFRCHWYAPKDGIELGGNT